MLPRKPDSLALIVALAGSVSVLGTFMIDLFLSRQRNLDDGLQRLQHFSLMLAEHTARSFEAIDILLRDAAADLSNNHRDWRQWEPARGWEYIAQRHSRSLPQLRNLLIVDEKGDQRFISTYFPTPRINIADLPYFAPLQKGSDFATYGPYLGRNSGRYTYGLARRIQDSPGVFAGAVFGAVEPAYFPDFCWGNRLADDFEAVLINAKGLIVASCRPTDLTRQAQVIGAPAADVLVDGKLKGRLPENGLISLRGLQVSLAPVPGYADLRVLAVIPENTVLANWQRRAVEFSIFACLVVAVLLSGSWLVRRQIRELSSVTAALDEHRKLLEQHVRSATAELAEKKEEAERANTAKSRFLAAASHDLRQPLHALSLFAADLQRQLRSGNHDELQRLAEQITTSTNVLGELLDSLLDVSRLDVAGVKTDIQPFALQAVFDRLASSYRRAAQGKNITLRFRRTTAAVESDSALIERLLANLVSNAIRYTPAGGRVLVAARRQANGKLRVEVRDNGIGIAPEHQAAIFAEFYQVGNSAREQNMGLGLGLSIVDRLARALDIPVALRSRPGTGTCFSIVLPPAREQQGAVRPPAESTPATRVLFVGRRDEIAQASRLAKGWGFRTRLAADAGDLSREAQEGADIIVAEAEAAAAASSLAGNHCPLVVINVDGGKFENAAYNLRLPIRPAKLRALLEQLQKTVSKSMP